MKELLEKKVVEVDGHRMLTRFSVEKSHYPGPAVIFIPGLALSGRYMIPAAYHLSRALPVYIPDFPGLGESSKPQNILNLHELAKAVFQWLSALKIKQAVIVGNSFGSQIAAELAVCHPEAVLAGVLTGPTVDPKRRTPYHQLLDLTLDYIQSPAKSYVITGDILKCGLRRLFYYGFEALRDRIEDKLPAIQCPVLFLRGERDPLARQLWLEEAASLVRDSEIAVMPGVGHTPNFDKGAELVPYILNFLSEKNLISLQPAHAAWAS